jgi:hypothetical protein
MQIKIGLKEMVDPMRSCGPNTSLTTAGDTPASSISTSAEHAATHSQQVKMTANSFVVPHSKERKKIVSERTTPNCSDLKPSLLAPPCLLCCDLHVNLHVLYRVLLRFGKTIQGVIFVLDSCIYTPWTVLNCAHLHTVYKCQIQSMPQTQANERVRYLGHAWFEAVGTPLSWCCFATPRRWNMPNLICQKQRSISDAMHRNVL